MDPRLRAAVDASTCWYDDVFALHAIPARLRDGLWSALGKPPPWHSAAKTVEPGVDTGLAVRAVQAFEHCAVADSFGDLALDRHGFDLLFEATWLHHPPLDDPPPTMPGGWSVVRTPDLLAAWNRAREYTDVLLPRVLDLPAFAILAKHQDGALVAGAAAHRCSGTVGLSNAWSADGSPVDHAELLAVIGVLHPGRAVTDYANGEDRDAMLAAGYAPLGPQLVWIR